MISVVTPTAVLPVSVEDVKANSYITTDDEAGLIEGMIRAAVADYESLTGQVLMTQTLELRLTSWPAESWISLERYPVQSVASVKYIDADGAEQTWDALNYVVDTNSEPGRIWLQRNQRWPSATLRPGPSIAVQFTAGYGALPDAVPADVRQWLLREAGDRYEHREHTVLQPGVTMAVLNARNATIRNNRRI